jgi:hypothetical protein
VLAALRGEVIAGNTSPRRSRRSRVFSELYRTLVAAGESSGSCRACSRARRLPRGAPAAARAPLARAHLSRDRAARARSSWSARCWSTCCRRWCRSSSTRTSSCRSSRAR